jgi:hypothetical protein
MKSTATVERFRCTECGRGLARHECILSDDPMAPFGPEMTCPDCGALALPWTPLWVIGLGLLLAVVLGGLFAAFSR